MVCLAGPSSRGQACAAEEAEQRASGKVGPIDITVDGKSTVVKRHDVYLSVKRAECIRDTTLICFAIVIYTAVDIWVYIKRCRDLMRTVNKARCNAKSVLCSLSKFGSCLTGKTKLASAVNVDRSCGGFKNYDDKQGEQILYKINNECYDIITNNKSIKCMHTFFDYAVKIKQSIDKSKVTQSGHALRQEVTRHATLKTNDRHEQCHAQTTADSTKSATRCPSQTDISELASFRSSPTSWGSDSSQGSYDPFCQRQLSACTRETTTDDRNSDASFLLPGVTEYGNVSVEDIPLGSHCIYEPGHKALVESSAHPVFYSTVDLLKDESCKRRPINQLKTVFYYDFKTMTLNESLSETGRDELSLKTLVDEHSQTAATERRMSDFQDRSGFGLSDRRESCTAMLPDVHSQTQWDYPFNVHDKTMGNKMSLETFKSEYCDKDNQKPKIEDFECVIETVDFGKRVTVEKIMIDKRPLTTCSNARCNTDSQSLITEEETCLTDPAEDCKKVGATNISHGKCSEAKCSNDDCYSDKESSETVDAECSAKPLEDCKENDVKDCKKNEVKECKENEVKQREENEVKQCEENEVEEVVEQITRNNSAKNKNKIVFKVGKYCKTHHAENVSLTMNDRMSANLPYRTQQKFYLSESASLCINIEDAIAEMCMIAQNNVAVSKDASDERLVYPYSPRYFHRVSRFSAVESRGQDMELFDGLRQHRKFDPLRHMPWRYNMQSFNQVSSVTSVPLHMFMNFEVFRLSSFDFSKFPKDASILVTHLAKSGFYFESKTVKIICFGCGNVFEGSQDSLQSCAESFHSPICTRRVSNTPLDQWIQGLNLDALTEYFIQNGSLTPYLEEPPTDAGDSIRSASQKNVLEAKPVLYLEPGTTDDSSGFESEGLQYLESESESHSYSQALLTDYSERNLFEYPFMNHSHSLPSNLNQISGVVVIEERSEPGGPHSVLTSASKRPLLIRSGSSSIEDSDESAEEGAVGGIPALNLDGASYPHFSIEAVRRQSFTVWSPGHSHRPEDLAAAGFFYAGYSDCVRCFYCGLGLKYWRPADIPAYQHAKYRPLCRFNVLLKGQDYIDKVQRELRFEQEAGSRAETQTGPEQPRQTSQTAITAQREGDSQEPDYLNSEAAQDALGNGWTRDQVSQAVSHIVNVYGESCLEIGLLTDILTYLNTQDDPSQGLPSNSPVSNIGSGINSSVSQLTTPNQSSAPHVNAVARSGNEQDRPGANQTRQEEATPISTSHLEEAMPIDTSQHEETTPGRTSRGEQPEVRVPDLRDILTSVEREHALLEERVTCRMCKSRPVSCIYLPCGHVIACQECADNATHCVFCSKVIIGTANVFLA